MKHWWITVAIGGMLLGLCQKAYAETLLEMRFQDKSALADITTSDGSPFFQGVASGLSLESGALKIRNEFCGRRDFYAPFRESDDTRLWLLVELDGWNLQGRPGETLSFALAWQNPSSSSVLFEGDGDLSDVAEIRITRYKKERAYLDARAFGSGATSIKNGQVLALEEKAPARILLMVDKQKAIYASWYQKDNAAWRFLGQGATDAQHSPKFFRMGFSQLLNDTPDEGVGLRNVSISSAPPPGVDVPEDPYVTAKNWGVADAETGEIIGGEGIASPTFIASIAKVMTALGVVEFVQKQPSLLDEMLQCTDATEGISGSNSGLPSGARISVRDALYAMMLPSGNDLAVLLAESLSSRFSPPEEPSPTRVPATRANFIAEMNRKANVLGMKSTRYRHPAYDPGEPGSTVQDQLKLACYAMKNPLFREIVGSKSHTATVTDGLGNQRRVTWENSNRILGRNGFLGIKTGTNKEAGPCLLSAVGRGGKTYCIAVFGSESYGRRYANAENIADWVFQK